MVSTKILAGDIPSATIFNKFLSHRGSENVTYTWNPDGSPATAVDVLFGITYTFSYDIEGDLASWTDGTNTWTLTYGSEGSVTSVVES